jgi:hypothetical protein
MVLDKERGNPGIRFLFGVCIIALCIYIFYIVRTMQISPELFLVPTEIQTREYPCKVVRAKGLLFCIPAQMGYRMQADGLHFYSLEHKVTGLFQVQQRLPNEQAWRDSLSKTLIRPFLGEVDGMDAFTLMKIILEKKYNPTLMGSKANILPAWFRGKKEACILIPEGLQALLFYTPDQCLGLLFREERVIILSTTGRLDKTLAASFLRSITLP